MKTILITGSNGQLGTELQNILANHASVNVIATDVDQLDITDDAAVDAFLTKHDINFVVNCAAYTAVDLAESNAEICGKINNAAVEILGRNATKHGAKIIHISTDYVFDGTNHKPYTESDTPCPQSVYGTTKLQGENALIAANPEAIIIRTGWLYSPYGKNFVKTMLNLGQTKPALKVVSDQVGTPTYAHDLAQAIVTIIQADNWTPGIYHFSDEGVASWFDFATEILDIAGIHSCAVNPCLTSEYPTAAQRPHYSVLDKSKIKQTYGVSIPYWKHSLKECIERILNP